MLKIFRKIRYNLIETGKTSKYLKYALGEITLVMIGILLALQVNSWYQHSQERNLEKKLLSEFKNSIISDSLMIDRNLSNFLNIVKKATYLDSIIKNKHPHTKDVDSAFGAISVFTVTESNYVIFDRLKSLKSGIISNDSLFTSLSNYYNFSKFLADVDRYFQNGAYFRKDIYPKYFKYYRYGRIAKVADYDVLLNSNEIKIAIDYCINDANYYWSQTRHRKEHARELINNIRKELKRFD